MVKEIKAVICGDSTVGKTSIYNRFFEEEFNPNVQPTIGGLFHKKYVENKETYELSIWDTAGDERYNSIIPSFFRNACVVIIVFDVTKRHSFLGLSKWINLAHENASANVPFIIVGNKVDLYEKREVTSEELATFAREVQAYNFIETSAKTGEGIDDLFSHITSVQTFVINHTANISPKDIKQLPEKKSCC